MAQTIVLAYKGTANGYIRAVVSVSMDSFVYIGISTTGYLGYRLSGLFVPSSIQLSDDVWYSLACSINGSSLSLYCNGSFVAAATHSSTLPNADRIGNLNPYGIPTLEGLAPQTDGAGTGVAPQTDGAGTGLAPMSEGGYPSSSSNGTIDEVQEYDSALDPSTLAELAVNYTLLMPLPSFPLGTSFNESAQEGILRTTMDTGYPKIRTRFSATLRYISCQYFLSANQRQILDQFYDSLGGSLSFYWPNPDTGVVETVRFARRPTYQLTNGIFYIASIALEALP